MRLKKAYYSALTSAIYQLVSIICGLILPRLILTYYGSVYNGVVSSITQFLGFFSVLQAGLQGATRVALYKPLSEDDNLRVSSIMKANQRYYRQISIVLLGYVLFLAVLFPLLISERVTRSDIVLLVVIIGASNFVQYFFGNAYKALLSADQASYILNILQTLTIVLNTIICAIIICSGGTIIFAKLGSAFIYSLNPIVLYLYVQYKYKFEKLARPDKTALKGRWDVLANSFANIIHENVDMLCITLFSSSLEVSVYAVYNLVVNGLTRFTFVFSDGIEAAFGNMWAKEENETLNKNFSEYEHIVFSITTIITSCMVTLILPFVNNYTVNVTDVNYNRPVFALLLSIAFATMCIRIPYIAMVQATGHYKETKIGSFFEAAINICLTLIFVQIIGIEGAVIGTIAANTFRSIQYGYYSSKNLIKRPFKVIIYRIIWEIGTILCNIVCLYVIVNKLRMTGWIGLIIETIICFSISSIIVIVASLLFYRNDFVSAVIHVQNSLLRREKMST